jgi:acetolactate synthase-1/2/3 large subunit
LNEQPAEQLSQTGAHLLALELVQLGVTTVFCISGAGNLAMLDACARAGIRFVFSHHEQACVMEAIGYAQVTGQVGVAMVTTGGGAANAVTGALSAHLDSVPLLILAGNESDYHIQDMRNLRAYGVQGFDSVAVLKPITKAAVRVTRQHDVRGLVSQSYRHASEGRPGPVFVEFPMNLQRQPFDSDPLSAGVHAAPIFERSTVPPLEPGLVRALSVRLTEARRPLIYIGNGARLAGATPTLLRIAERFSVPFMLSWSAIDLVDEGHPLLVGRAGIYGDRFANVALQASDLLLAIGTRLAIPQVGYDRNDFARNADRWVVDIDSGELAKLDSLQWTTVHADSEIFSRALELELDEPSLPPDRGSWLASLGKLKLEFPRESQIGPLARAGFVHSFDVVNGLSDALPDDAIVVTDVGAGLLTGHYGHRVKKGQRFFTSQGLGEMGFGLPGAIGAQIAAPGRMVVCLNTDGGIMFNLQELQVVATHQLPIKLFVFNNDGYGMIRTSQDNLFQANRVGSDVGRDLSFPDFRSLAIAFGFGYTRMEDKAMIGGLLAPVLSSAVPELVEVRMDPDQLYLPRLATRKNSDGTLVSPAIEHLTPEIAPEDLVKRVNHCGLELELGSAL